MFTLHLAISVFCSDLQRSVPIYNHYNPSHNNVYYPILPCAHNWSVFKFSIPVILAQISCCGTSEEVYAFSAYINNATSLIYRNQILVFNGVTTNLGGAYNPVNGLFRCLCSGKRRTLKSIVIN